MNAQSLLERRLASSANEFTTPTEPTDTLVSAEKNDEDLSEEIREKLNRAFGEQIHQRANEEEFKRQMERVIYALLDEKGVKKSAMERARFATRMLNDILGFGPLQPLIEDESVTEIMVVGPEKVYAEQQGKLTLTDTKFASAREVQNLINKIVGPLGRRCDESTPNVDARLPDGSRVSASIQPIALDGPYITIRKFSKKGFTLDDYVRLKSMSREMAQFLEACVNGRVNIFVSGGTGSGKTTLLNCLSNYIDPRERIVTIEDSAELQLKQPHVERYESRPANVEGKGAITIRDLVIYSLRKRPDRIVVGEVRGGEALEMLQAMNTGHDGSLSTGHSNSPREMMSRLETMVLMSGMELPVRAIRETIAGAVQLVVQVSRLKDGSRKITAITEVVGMGREGADKLGLKNFDKESICLQDIFRFKQEGVDAQGKVNGRFVATGHRPIFLDRLQAQGIHLDPQIFEGAEG